MSYIVKVAIAIVMTLGSAAALEVSRTEKSNLKACERELCEIVHLRKATAQELTCDLQKTWAKKSIENGAASKSIDWSLGDARCKVNLAVAQLPLVKALTRPKYELKLPEHAIRCVVERGGEVTPVNLSIAPQVAFKKGKAVEATLDIDNIEAPALLKSAIWTVAQLESSFKLFERDILRQINKFVRKKCAKRYPDLKP